MAFTTVQMINLLAEDRIDMVIKICICYALEDGKLLQEFEKHLQPLVRNGHIAVWHAGKIAPGARREQAILTHMQDARIILPLLSPDFVSSNAYNDLLQMLQERSKSTLLVIPIILRAIDWQAGFLDGLAPLPKNAVPVKEWDSRDNAWHDIVQYIKEAAATLANVDAETPASAISETKVPAASVPVQPTEARQSIEADEESSIHHVEQCMTSASSGQQTISASGKSRISHAKQDMGSKNG